MWLTFRTQFHTSKPEKQDNYVNISDAKKVILRCRVGDININLFFKYKEGF